MNFNQNNLSIQPWNPEMYMEDHQILGDQLPSSSIWPVSHPLQNQQSPLSSSTQLQISSLLGGQMGKNPREEEQEKEEEEEEEEEPEEELGAMKEMMYKIAAMQPVDIDLSSIRKPKRRNVRISDDPQSVAARHRRERISEKLRILQRLVPGGTKMDTASMLDEAIRYVKFLKKQVRLLQTTNQRRPFTGDRPITYNRPVNTAISASIETPFGGSTGFPLGGSGMDVESLCFKTDPKVISD